MLGKEMTSEHQYVISSKLLTDKDPHTFFSAIDAGYSCI